MLDDFARLQWLCTNLKMNPQKFISLTNLVTYSIIIILTRLALYQCRVAVYCGSTHSLLWVSHKPIDAIDFDYMSWKGKLYFLMIFCIFKLQIGTLSWHMLIFCKSNLLGMQPLKSEPRRYWKKSRRKLAGTI